MKTAFDIQGNWYKGVTHVHSDRSDGRWTPEQLVGWYRAHDYHFLALTDHLVCTEAGHLSTPDLLVLPGIEIHGYDPSLGRTPHVVGLGTGIVGTVEQGTSFQGIVDLVNERGMLAIVAHPYWSALRDEHLSAVNGYVGVEIYNQTCWEDVGKGDSLACWDNMLHEGREVWGLAVDDAHCLARGLDVGGGWIMVKAPALTEGAILTAIRSGHFYASTGPAIETWQVSANEVYVRCSPVERIQMHGANGGGRTVCAPPGQTITEATLRLREINRYLRITCIDAQGKRAWTNPVFAAR